MARPSSVTARPDRAYRNDCRGIALEEFCGCAEAECRCDAGRAAETRAGGCQRKDGDLGCGYVVQPEFDYANGRQTFRNYLARNTVEVRLDDIEQSRRPCYRRGCHRRRHDDYGNQIRRAQPCGARTRRAASGCGRRAFAPRCGGGGAPNATIDGLNFTVEESQQRAAAPDDADGRAGRRARCRDAGRAVHHRNPVTVTVSLR